MARSACPSLVVGQIVNTNESLERTPSYLRILRRFVVSMRDVLRHHRDVPLQKHEEKPLALHSKKRK